MKEKLISRLFVLQKKIQLIDIYNDENGRFLFKYSIEFESLLVMLLKLNEQKFNNIYIEFSRGTQKYCELGCGYKDETNREEAFLLGLNKINLCIKDCLETLAV